MDVIDFILHKESCIKAEAIHKAVALTGSAIPTSTSVPASEASTPAKPTISREQFLQNIFT